MMQCSETNEKSIFRFLFFEFLWNYTGSSFLNSFFHRRRRRRIPKWAPQAPPKRGTVGTPFFFPSFTAAEGGGKWAPVAPLPWRTREIPPKAGIFWSLIFFRHRRWRKQTPRAGRPWQPKFFYFLYLFLSLPLPPPPKSGAVGATPLEGEGNPAEGGYFASF